MDAIDLMAEQAEREESAHYEFLCEQNSDKHGFRNCNICGIPVTGKPHATCEAFNRAAKERNQAFLDYCDGKMTKDEWLRIDDELTDADGFIRDGKQEAPELAQAAVTRLAA